ncbi:psychosine receptor-like [Physella acuta]|uniref:psychosine receptor-like n=1 Tax=Physella acuta TaxID=109671 RepID=UPI0027DE4E0C|nr:psychosine receptor-like [Physella acuta]
MAVFVKMGLKDPVNITLLALSVSDLGASATLFLFSLCKNPALAQEVGVFSYPVSWPQLGFIRTSSWLVVHTTIERYLCVAFPLKFRHLVTSRRTLGLVVLVFAVFLASIVPPFLASEISFRFDQNRNQNTLVLVFFEDKQYLEEFSAIFNSYALLASFPIVIFFTCLLVGKLTSQSKWRNEMSTAGKNEKITLRDRKVVKMILLISCTFILCFLPEVVATLAMQYVPDFRPGGKLSNLYYVSWSVIFNCNAVNSTAPIFVYLSISSKFRFIFTGFCGKRGQVKFPDQQSQID